jgi:hypothetical protein
MSRSTFIGRSAELFDVLGLLRVLGRLRRVPLLVAAAVLAGCAGNVNDYLEEAKLGDPESIKEAVVMTGALLSQKEQTGYPFDAGDEEAIKFLTEVAEKGPDAVNRASAIDSLGKLRRPRLTSLYIRGLDDKSWSVQLEAVKALERNPDPDAVAPLRRKLDADLSLAVRLEIVKALAVEGGDEALKTLVEVFLDGSSRYRNMKLAAYDGIRKLSGKDYAFDATESWRAFLAERFPKSKGPGEPQPGATIDRSGLEKPPAGATGSPGASGASIAPSAKRPVPERPPEEPAPREAVPPGAVPPDAAGPEGRK